MDKYQSINYVKKHFKRTFWTELKYFGFYIWWNWLESRPRKIYWFFQRGWKGYADCDTWNFDNYLCKVIIGGLKQLKKYSHHQKPTKKDYNVMIRGFEVNLKMMENPKKYDRLLPKFYKGMELFKEYFNYLWD